MKKVQGKFSKEIKLNSRKLGYIFYSDKETELETVATVFKVGYLKASRFFKIQISSVNVILIYSRKEMNKTLGSKTKNWFIGYANSYNTITIFSPSVFEKESPHKKREFKKALLHEITHLFIRKIHSTYEPVWLEEGLAYYIAGQGREQIADKKSLLITQEAIFLLDTRRRWEKSVSNEPNNAYSLSYLFVKFLIVHFNKEKIIKLLTELRERYTVKNFCQRFKEVYGLDITDVLKKFLEYRFNLKGGENNHGRT